MWCVIWVIWLVVDLSCFDIHIALCFVDYFLELMWDCKEAFNMCYLRKFNLGCNGQDLKRSEFNCWLCRILLRCHILIFICYKVLNVYTKNPNWLPCLPPRTDVCNQLGYFEQMKKKITLLTNAKILCLD